MKKSINKLVIAGIVMFLDLPVGWSGEFNYASYTQATLHDIIAEQQNQSPDQPEIEKYAGYVQLECRVSKYRVSCYFHNITRPIAENKKNAITLWMEMLKIDPKHSLIYHQEIRVSEGAEVHWIPIQEKLLPHLKQELDKNDPVELFIIVIGQVESEFVFIATEFEKPISPAKNSIQATARAAL